MEFITDRHDNIVIFKITEKLDSLSAPKAEKALLPAIEENGKYILNMGQLTHISSAGLRVLLMAAKKVRSTNSRMILCDMSETIHEIFDIAGFSSIFEIKGSQQEAIQAL